MPGRALLRTNPRRASPPGCWGAAAPRSCHLRCCPTNLVLERRRVLAKHRPSLRLISLRLPLLSCPEVNYKPLNCGSRAEGNPGENWDLSALHEATTTHRGAGVELSPMFHVHLSSPASSCAGSPGVRLSFLPTSLTQVFIFQLTMTHTGAYRQSMNVSANEMGAGLSLQSILPGYQQEQ